MKEDHVVAGILLVLIAALIFGAVSSADSNGITAGATTTPFTGGGAGTVFLVAMIAIAMLAGAYGLYQLYFRDKFRKPVKTAPIGPLNLSFDKSGGLKPDIEPKPEDPMVGKVFSYIKTQRGKGEADMDIRAKLRAVGWKADIIDRAFKKF